ncbi:MAG: septation ring formation regulator EzrA [Bacilli bacterium]|nr:septation ring formation regulator EzrA [Bacilli bacterium]
MHILASDNNIVGIAIIISVIAVILVIVFILLYVFVFSRKAYKRQIRDLEKKYSYCNALLVGQDSQYINRLEIISRTNLLYVEKYTKYSKRFKEVFENDDRFAQSMLKQLNSLVAGGQYKNLKAVISDAKHAINSFEEAVTLLDRDLVEVIKPEEEARQAILKLRENYRRVKKIFYSNSNDLELVATSFTKVFDKLDRNFLDFDEHIESAEYEEANNLLPVIANVIKALESALSSLPNLCIVLQTVVPEKIHNLTNEYTEYERKGIPLFNLSFRHKVDEWNQTLEHVKNSLIQLKTAGIMEQLEKIIEEVEQMHNRLINEIEDKKIFETEELGLYQSAINLEKEFLKICSLLPEVNDVYIICKEQLQNIEVLKTDMNNLGKSKRVLDNYIHSGTKQPYSILRSKMEELKKDYDVAYKGIQDFKAYIEGLKSYSEEAYSMVFVYYYNCKKCEAMLREINVTPLYDNYQPQIETCYNLLNEIDQTIKTKPIDVAAVNEKVEELKHIANALFEDIENKYRECQLAESAIVYANRDRKHQQDVHQQLCVLEKSFFNGEFGKVYHDANSLYRRMHVEDSNNGR